MDKKNILGLAILAALLIIVGAVGYYVYRGMDRGVDDQDAIEEIETRTFTDDLNFNQEYLGNNLWRYEITGTLPNPCYTIAVRAEVTEEEGEETATIYSTITSPSPDEICAQVIQEVYEEGEFEASENVSILFDTSW